MTNLKVGSIDLIVTHDTRTLGVVSATADDILRFLENKNKLFLFCSLCFFFDSYQEACKFIILNHISDIW